MLRQVPDFVQRSNIVAAIKATYEANCGERTQSRRKIDIQIYDAHLRIIPAAGDVKSAKFSYRSFTGAHLVIY